MFTHFFSKIVYFNIFFEYLLLIRWAFLEYFSFIAVVLIITQIFIMSKLLLKHNNSVIINLIILKLKLKSWLYILRLFLWIPMFLQVLQILNSTFQFMQKFLWFKNCVDGDGLSVFAEFNVFVGENIMLWSVLTCFTLARSNIMKFASINSIKTYSWPVFEHVSEINEFAKIKFRSWIQLNWPQFLT